MMMKNNNHDDERMALIIKMTTTANDINGHDSLPIMVKMTITRVMNGGWGKVKDAA
jgi:hypothetical protein